MAHQDAFDPDLPVYRNLVGTEDQRRWLARLPELVVEFERRWSVSTGRPYRTGTSAWTAPGTTADGRAVVLKIVWPHREAAGEALGLRAWDGDSAVRLHESDPQRYALLLERCEPGTTLAESGLSAADTLAVAAPLLGRLWAAEPGPVRPERLVDVLDDWTVEGQTPCL